MISECKGSKGKEVMVHDGKLSLESPSGGQALLRLTFLGDRSPSEANMRASVSLLQEMALSAYAARSDAKAFI